jgi:16S rRNA (cytidine1402-2'-O)-methyltransferase
MTTLYLVPTPLGNLEDITLRALRVLRQVSVVATEDTRTTGKLLKHFDIKCSMISYHEHSKQGHLDRVLHALAQADVALVSEAGMPLLSDPGYKLVRAAIEQGVDVVGLPGPSAITTALAVSGLPTDRFLFWGFLPRKQNERRNVLTELATQPATLLFFEAPHRVQASLADMADIFGPDRSISVCRELTKLHEEIWRGTVAGALETWTKRDPRGEFTLVVAGASPPAAWDVTKVEQALSQALAAGMTRKDAVRQVTDQSGWSKRDVYALAQKIKVG